MSRHSVLCRDSGARHCVATRLCVRDRDALSRQCSAALHRNNVALHYVTTEKATHARQTRSGGLNKASAPRLGAHDRGIMSRERFLYHDREKKKRLPGIEASQVLYEDNVVCIAQVKGIYIKGDQTKHISPKFLYTHELKNSGEINVQQIRSSDNLAYLFTKALPTTTFKKLVH